VSPEIVTDSIVMRGVSGTVRRIEACRKVEKLRHFTGREY
jgi:fructose-1,6-bisphosphatase/sedoheptulose 1,7-bisphosphatase-like protein